MACTVGRILARITSIFADGQLSMVAHRRKDDNAMDEDGHRPTWGTRRCLKKRRQLYLNVLRTCLAVYRPVNVAANARISRSTSALFDRNMKRFAPGSSTIRAVGTAASR